MTNERYIDRRKALKIAGAGIASSVAMVGPASADGKPLPREASDGRTIYATWGDDEIWEIFDAEPPERWRDSEGNDSAHEPLYFMKGLPTSYDEHSPHIGFPPSYPVDGVDHVVPVPGGTDEEYSAQWHPKAVVDPDQKFVFWDHDDDSSTDPIPFPNLVNQDAAGHYLTSSTKVENALADGEVGLLVAPEEAVFTCPVRPHGNQGHDD